MKIQRIPLWLLILNILIMCGMPFFAVAVDPLNLQKQGISQVDGSIDHYRKTGDQQTRLPDLHQTVQELSQNLQIFLQQGDYGSAALSLVNQRQSSSVVQAKKVLMKITRNE